jgi:hypothetical protein
VRRSLRHPLPHLNDPAQPLKQVHGLLRGQPVRVEDSQNIVNDFVVRIWYMRAMPKSTSFVITRGLSRMNLTRFLGNAMEAHIWTHSGF